MNDNQTQLEQKNPSAVNSVGSELKAGSRVTYTDKDVVPGATFAAVHPVMTITPQSDTVTVTWVEEEWVTYSRASGYRGLHRQMDDFLTIINDPKIEKFNLSCH